MRRVLTALFLLVLSGPVIANDWEKFFRPMASLEGLEKWAGEPEIIAFSGNLEKDMENMWRHGFVAVGVTSFNSPNNKTSDGIKFAKKLGARYMIVSTTLSSSSTVLVPMTNPSTSTTYNSGTVSASGSGGYASGVYAGTSTTHGSQTTYLPMQVNRFGKEALYFMPAPKYGAGIMPRDLTPDEVTKIETRRAFAVRWVRDGSPAYDADLLPGDIVLSVNGEKADRETWLKAIRQTEPLNVEILRGNDKRSLTILIPPDRRPQN